ncbi:MAG: hypothetical protein WC517_02240 [Patescibacteria group bacterium]
MRWQERQDRVEAAVYEAIDELADVLNLEVPFYPEVFWIGRTLKFEDTGLPAFRRDFFEIRRTRRESYFYPRNTIIINSASDQNTINEEASHFLHFAVSGLRFGSRSLGETVCLRVITEMLASFGARLLGSGRHADNRWEIIPDLSRLPESDWQKIIDACSDWIRSYTDFCELYIYQQGYGLGNRLYCEYLAGQVSLGFIRNLFLDDLTGADSSTKKFLKLKKKLWPPGFQLIGTKAVA